MRLRTPSPVLPPPRPTSPLRSALPSSHPAFPRFRRVVLPLSLRLDALAFTLAQKTERVGGEGSAAARVAEDVANELEEVIKTRVARIDEGHDRVGSKVGEQCKPPGHREIADQPKQRQGPIFRLARSRRDQPPEDSTQ